MKTDSPLRSVAYGRFATALILIITAVLQALGVEPEKIKEFEDLLNNLMAQWPIFLAAALAVASKLREMIRNGKLAPTIGRSGRGNIMCIMVLALVAMIGLAGCKFLNKKERFCDAVPKDSYSLICQAAHFFNTEPEEIAFGFKIGSLAATNKYGAQKVKAYLDRIEMEAQKARMLNSDLDLSNDITWGMILDFVVAEHRLLPPEIQAAINLCKAEFDFNMPTFQALRLKLPSSYDWSGFDMHMADQRALLLPFLLSQ